MPTQKWISKIWPPDCDRRRDGLGSDVWLGTDVFLTTKTGFIFLVRLKRLELFGNLM